MPVATTENQGNFQIVHSLEYLGEIYGMPRFEGEEISHYQSRLMRIYEERASSRTSDLIHQITLDLGAIPVPVLYLKKEDYSYKVEKTNNEFRIVDKEESTDILFYRNLIKEIGVDSAWWASELINDILDVGLFNMEILQSNSDLETMKASMIRNHCNTRINLTKNIIRKVTTFEEDSIYDLRSDNKYVQNKVASLSLIAEKGDYYYDKDLRRLHIYEEPTYNTNETNKISYSSIEDEMILEWSPVCLQELSDRIYLLELLRSLNNDIDNLDADFVMPKEELFYILSRVWKEDKNNWWNHSLVGNKLDKKNRILSSQSLLYEINETLDKFYFSNYSNVRDLI